MMKIGVQLYSVRGEMEKDFEGTLKQVKDMGYECVEFAGLFGRTAAEVKALCDAYGLIPISAHVSLDDLREDPFVLQTYADIGCKYVAIPSLDKNDRPGHPGFEKTVQDMAILGAFAKKLGMKLAYHNHDFEFEKVDGKYALDILFDAVPADLLLAQLDTCWVNVGGADPVAYIHKYNGRVEILHFKDFAGKKSENMYALLGVNDGKKEATVGDFEYRPLGQGLQDVPALVQAAKACGTEWAIVEIDDPSRGKTPMQCIKESIDYFKTIV